MGDELFPEFDRATGKRIRKPKESPMEVDNSMGQVNPAKPKPQMTPAPQVRPDTGSWFDRVFGNKKK